MIDKKWFVRIGHLWGLQAGKLEGTVCWKLSRLQFSNQRKTEKGENTTFFLIFEKRSLFHCQLLLQVGCALQAKSLQSCMILCDPMDCSLPGSSVHGILQARYWSGLPCSSPEDLPNPGIKPATPPSPALAGGFFTTSTILEALRVRQGSLFFFLLLHDQARIVKALWKNYFRFQYNEGLSLWNFNFQ